MQVMVDGLMTSYEAAGEGKTLLLLHGWGDRAVGLKALQTALAAKFYVIAPDLPGFGGTQVAANVWGLDEYATFISHFLEKLGVKKVYAIVGHSNGGAIAIKAVANNVVVPQRLVLLASAGIRGEAAGRRKVLQGATKVGKFLTMPLPDPAKRALRRRLYDMVRSDMLVAEHLQETFKKIVSEDLRKDAASITIPTLLIYGGKDRSAPVRYGEIFHQRIKGSTLQILPNAGHFAHIDEPQKVVTTIEEFLA